MNGGADDGRGILGGVTGGTDGDWWAYWRSPDEPLEAMHARFREHVYHRHSHDSYSFGVTEWGAQSFRCRHAAHTSAAGMVMAFNPDDPHDGRASTDRGFHYRMIHIGPGLVTAMLSDIGRPPPGTAAVRGTGAERAPAGPRDHRLHVALTGPEGPLERGERLLAAIAAASRFAVTPGPAGARVTQADLPVPPAGSATTWRAP